MTGSGQCVDLNQETTDMYRSKRRIHSEAAEWGIRSQGRELSSAQRAELDQWLEESPRHRGAFLRASAAWVDLDRLAAMAGSRGQLDSDERPPPRTKNWAFAAGIAVLMLGAIPAWWAARHHNVYTSEAGQVRHVDLS